MGVGGSYIISQLLGFPSPAGRPSRAEPRDSTPSNSRKKTRTVGEPRSSSRRLHKYAGAWHKRRVLETRAPLIGWPEVALDACVSLASWGWEGLSGKRRVQLLKRPEDWLRGAGALPPGRPEGGASGRGAGVRYRLHKDDHGSSD